MPHFTCTQTQTAKAAAVLVAAAPGHPGAAGGSCAGCIERGAAKCPTVAASVTAAMVHLLVYAWQDQRLLPVVKGSTIVAKIRLSPVAMVLMHKSVMSPHVDCTAACKAHPSAAP